jgi:uncharacterized protein DUF5666
MTQIGAASISLYPVEPQTRSYHTTCLGTGVAAVEGSALEVSMNSVPFRSLLLAISVVLAISCGDNASLSPTAPSGSGGGTGAVIIGQVMSGASAPVTPRSTADRLATANTFATADSASVTVKVVGTNISTTTNGQGQFTLTGVPPGEVRLEFTGAGGSATISISGVKATDEIRISVSLNGSNARVDSEHRTNHGDNSKEQQTEVKGVVSGLTGTCPKVSFMVHNTKVTASETTQFEHVKCADIKNGSVVEVKGSRGSDGSITAMKVENDDDDDDEDDDDRRDTQRNPTQAAVKGVVSGLTGTCPKVSFTVQTTKVTTAESTRFEDVRCGAIKNGMTVEVTGARQADGSITATKVESDD